MNIIKKLFIKKPLLNFIICHGYSIICILSVALSVRKTRRKKA